MSFVGLEQILIKTALNLLDSSRLCYFYLALSVEGMG